MNFNLKENGEPVVLKSFIAFDLETTGFSFKFDDITEIAAIKVRDGKIEETKKFIFQELVHLLKKEIPFNVVEITGITNEMVKDARLVTDVLRDFQKFIGDDVLVGYNCLKFDRLFLNEACQYTGIKITNPYFDVLAYVPRFYKELHFSNRTLATISKVLDIQNPRAHRALADAITTAKVFLKLQELEQEKIGIHN